MTSGLDRKTSLPNLTTEPPLDPPEPIDYKALFRRRDQMQKYTPTPRFQWEQEIKEAEIVEMEAEEEQRLNLWRQQSEDDEREWAIAQEEKEL
jgi:hypothetical protein